MIKEITKRPNTDFYKSKLLDIFRPLTIFNDHGIKERQLEILSAFQKNKFQILDLQKIDHLIEEYTNSLNALIAGCPE